MWKIQKFTSCKIIDDKTNCVIAANLEEEQARQICDTHNDELGKAKWNKDIKSDC